MPKVEILWSNQKAAGSVGNGFIRSAGKQHLPGNERNA